MTEYYESADCDFVTSFPSNNWSPRHPPGKTHTMLGNDSDPGTIPRVVQQMFDCIEQTPDREYLIRVSYMEIYREVRRDVDDSR